METHFARRMQRVSASAIMELIKTTAGGNFISFASGLPDPSLFPARELRDITDDILTRDDNNALQYGAAEGFAPLRDWVAQRLRERGLKATAENVLITSGSQQALDLVARALLDAGDTVLMESPSYLAAIQAFDSYEVNYVTLPMDEDGMDTAALEKALASCSPKLIFTLPNFQNPTGITLSAERRQRVAELAAAKDIPILEDDAYYDLRYDGEPLPPIASLAENRWAFYTGTFSKTIAPGIRVGWVYGDADLIARLAQLKQITDLHSNSLTQRIAYEFCARGKLPGQIEFLCRAYKEKRDAMLTALQHSMPPSVRWTHPQGGMFLFLTLPDGQDGDALLPHAMERGVVFVPGASFHPNGGGANTVRLNFVSPPHQDIERGITLLAQTIVSTGRA
ncbi:MAG: PLP-dependent aminotransferase family protein [Abditibacteriales bacterium]|nr:PLP-dependent aminotransferase family protein [Abditibacteriales bacterium]MDW8367258.1 PLP-dependent aminotransferase family protein [Abditibacteriales bacterium]